MPTRERPSLTHVDESGRLRMVDVGSGPSWYEAKA